jgi:Amt family ammonium transporter
MSGGFPLLAWRLWEELPADTVKGAPRVLAAVTTVPYPPWLNPGDNTWQLTSATFVGLMSLPALAVLYGGLVQRKWVINTMLMIFSGFSAVLVVWMLWGYNLGFGPAAHLFNAGGTGFFANMWGHWHPITSHFGEQNQAVSDANTLIPFHYPTATLAYFQFVFAAITPLLFCGSILGRMKFKAWIIFVPLWTTFVYTIDAKLLWGGGFFAQHGAVDYSGGYVIHLSAGISGFVAAAIIGPRLLRDRRHGVPNNLLLVAVGAGILWLGWNGFNGGDPFYAGIDAASAVLNTNVATAVGLLTWMLMDWWFTKQKKPTFLGAINGMICGLVGITPAAGYVNGVGAIAIGAVCSAVVWVLFTYLPRKVWPFNRVDDALGVVYTHGFAGLLGGLLVGLFADPKLVVYLGIGKNPNVTTAGAFYGHPRQLLIQLGAAVTVIVWDGLITFLILKGIGLFTSLRYTDAELEVGDLLVHGEVAYPEDEPEAAEQMIGDGTPEPPQDKVLVE